MNAISATILLSLSVYLADTCLATPIKARQLRFFYLANTNSLSEFRRMLPSARKKTVEQALIYAATGDALDIVELLIGDESEHEFSRFQIKRTMELASEFGAANVVHYLLDSWDWGYEELERAERWARIGEHKLTHAVIMDKLNELNYPTLPSDHIPAAP